MQSPKLQRFLLASDKSLSFGCLFWNLFQCCFAAEWWDRLVALPSWPSLRSRVLPPPLCFPCNAPDLICSPQIQLLNCLVLHNNNSGINNSYSIIIWCLGQITDMAAVARAVVSWRDFYMQNETLCFISRDEIYSFLPPLPAGSELQPLSLPSFLANTKATHS